jgi:hypothetical protein
MSKIGLLVECGREGLEAIVCRRLCQLIADGGEMTLDLEIVAMDNKKNLLEGCGAVAANLLKDGCDRVVILWDERPAWPKMGEPLCWHNDRIKVLQELTAAHITLDRVHLVCIEREFESWLLFDDQMLATVLSIPPHKVKVPKHPDRQKNPKGLMTTLFRKLAGKTYVDVQFAKQFANGLTQLNRLRKCQTFKRFEQKILGREAN